MCKRINPTCLRINIPGENRFAIPMFPFDPRREKYIGYLTSEIDLQSMILSSRENGNVDARLGVSSIVNFIRSITRHYSKFSL